ncbi:MAG: hypothetical protein ACRDQA_26275 [Nocardioidaceae bacterium]
MVWTHGGDGDSVVTDSAGNVIPDYPVAVYDSATGGSHVQDLTEIIGGAAIAALRTDATGPTAGRIRRLHSASHPILWWSVGSDQDEVRWASHAHEIPTRANQAYTQANDNAANIAAIQAQIGGSSLYAVKTEVPSIEEILTSVIISWGRAANPQDMVVADSSRRLCPVLVAPYPLTILSADMVFNNGIAANASNYWHLQLQRGAGTNVIVGKTSHDEAIVNGAGWGFDNQIFDPDLRKLDEGQVLFVTCQPATGSPDPLLGPSTITVRYARQG